MKKHPKTDVKSVIDLSSEFKQVGVNYYDRVEEVELAHERAETAMSRLKKIEIEVRELSKT